VGNVRQRGKKTANRKRDTSSLLGFTSIDEDLGDDFVNLTDELEERIVGDMTKTKLPLSLENEEERTGKRQPTKNPLVWGFKTWQVNSPRNEDQFFGGRHDRNQVRLDHL
jgi:hypothetical protein